MTPLKRLLRPLFAVAGLGPRVIDSVFILTLSLWMLCLRLVAPVLPTGTRDILIVRRLRLVRCRRMGHTFRLVIRPPSTTTRMLRMVTGAFPSVREGGAEAAGRGALECYYLVMLYV